MRLRERLHHLDVVLDEQHRRPPLVLDVPERADEVTRLGVVEPDDGSSRSSRRGSVISARPSSTSRPGRG